MSHKNLYDVLGVDKSTSCADIKKAFLKLAKTHHPDKGGNAEAFKEMLMANEILSDESKRAHYDMTGMIPGETPGMPEGMGGFPFPFPVDINQIFSGMFGGNRGGPMGGNMPPGGNRQPFKRPGKPPASIEKLPLTMKELYDGYIFNVKLNRTVFCTDCDGTGAKVKDNCTTCHGSGTQSQLHQMGPMVMETRGPCSVCGGSGHIVRERCTPCAGSGKVQDVKQVEVNVPPGMNIGEYIVLPGACSELPDYEKPGDIHMIVEMKSNPYGWKRIGDHGQHIEKELIINLSESLLGCRIKLDGHPGFDEGLYVEIPPASFEGDVYCLSGLGMPIRDKTNEYGDLFIRIRVKVSNDERKELAMHGKETLDSIFGKGRRYEETNGEIVYKDMYLYRLATMP
jgi:DnaJ-class molecular chaperone